MKEIRFTEVAFNSPVLIDIDVTKGFTKRINYHVVDSIIGTMRTESSYVYMSAYVNGEEVLLVAADKSKFYTLLVEEIETSVEDRIYVFVHEKSGTYDGSIDAVTYFRSHVMYTFMSKSEYINACKSYGVDCDRLSF